MKIIVPLDGSQTAEAAVPIARRLGGGPGAAFVLLSVASVRLPQDPAPADAPLVHVSEAKSYLDAVKRRLLSDADVVTTVWCGPPAAAIISAARVYDADLIVMTSHGRTGRQRDMFGSVADIVLREAPVQVVVVRPRRDLAGTPTPATQAVTTSKV